MKAERTLTRREALRVGGGTLAGAALLGLTGCGSGGGSNAANADLSGAQLTVGSKDFTEQQILGYITVHALENAGATVTDRVGLAGTNAARQALQSGDIDMYWEYTGTIWIDFLGHTTPIHNSHKQYEAAKKQDLKKNNLHLLHPAPFNNTYALAIRNEEQKKLGVTKLSDLGPLIKKDPKEATLCVESEFKSRDDGLPGMEKKYGYQFPSGNVSLFDTGVIYNRTDKGNPCNFGEVFVTDGRIKGLGLYVLQDDKHFFPIYNPALEVRQSVYKKYGKQLDKIFTPIANALTTNTMQHLNAEADIQGVPFDAVAQKWLKQKGFIG